MAKKGASEKLKEIKVVAREAFFIKRSDITSKDVRKLEKRFTHLFFEERACKQCEYLGDREQAFPEVAEVCQTCAGFKGGTKLCVPHKEGGEKWVRLPAGDPKVVAELLKSRGYKIKWKVKHPDVEMKRPIKFKAKLRPYQRKALNKMWSEERGTLVANMGAGKTVMFSAFVCELGQKTLILASQRDWLDGFKETFIGSETQPAMTTCKKSQIGYCKKLEDFKRYDVCLVTVQTFHTPAGRKLLRKIRDLFGLIGVDEIQYGAADKYSEVLANLNASRLICLTGTPDRKDGRFKIVTDLVGPIIHKVKTESLRPHIKLTRTGYIEKVGQRAMWTTIVSKLEHDPARLKLIAKQALKDVKAGHLVMIPLARVTPIRALTEALNKMAGKTIARPFYGGLRKEERQLYIQQARKYKVKIMVGQARVMSTGINIPRASCIYDVTPSNNVPQATQRIGRILRPHPDKPTPMIRIFLDDSTARRRCLASEYYNVMKKVFNAEISDLDEVALQAYFKAGARRPWQRDEQSYSADF